MAKKTIGIYGNDSDPRVQLHVVWARENGHIPRIGNPKFFNPHAFRMFDSVIAIGDRSTEILAAYKAAGVKILDVPELFSPIPKKGGGWAPQLPVTDDMWKGQRCFIIGGGASLKGFDPSLLAGENVIAINRAVETFPATIAFSIDNRFYEGITSGRFGEKAKRQWMNHPRKVMVMTAGVGYPRCALSLSHPEDEMTMTESVNDGLGHGKNSGFGALNLALCLGADPIYLLGFDMKGDGEGGQAHFHSGYPKEWRENESRYPEFMRAFVKNADAAKSRSRIVNLNPESALECFEKASVDSVGFPDRPIYVSYYTPEYKEEMKGLCQSLLDLHLHVCPRRRESLFSWELNCAQKANVILETLEEYPDRKVVWLDADARMMRYPRLFDTCEADFAAFYLDGHELISATMMFGRGAASRRLVKKWIEAMKKDPQAWDQRVLQETLEHWRGKRERLPADYCSIFDHPKRSQDPVILQGQASRTLKGKVAG